MRILVLPIVFLTSCSDANHLGNPLTLPVRGIIAAAENAQYDARRDRVAAVLAEHQSAFQRGNSTLVQNKALFETAGTSRNVQRKVLDEVRNLKADSSWLESATVVVMVHS